MSIAYQLKRSKKRRSLSIKVKDGNVIVYAPDNLELHFIEQCVLKKRTWIEKHLKQQSNMDEVPSIIDSSNVCLLGQDYSVSFLVEQNQSLISTKQNEIIVQSSRRVAKTREKQLVLMTQHCTNLMQPYCLKRANQFSKLINEKVTSVSIKQFKRRWGSCNNKGDLQFNLQLISAPLWVLDYVIAHEVAHLREMNHSYRFWRVVKQLYPKFQIAERWLKENGYKLDVFKLGVK